MELNSRYFIKKISLWVFFLFWNIVMYAQEKIPVSIEFSGIKTEKGTLRMGLFKSKDAFEKEKPFEFFVVEKTGFKNGSLTQSFQFPKGEYAISVWDDANDNGKMDKTIVGIPKEGYGFGDYIHKSFSKPNYDDFKMKISNTNQKVQVQFRYLYP